MLIVFIHDLGKMRHFLALRIHSNKPCAQSSHNIRSQHLPNATEILLLTLRLIIFPRFAMKIQTETSACFNKTLKNREQIV